MVAGSSTKKNTVVAENVRSLTVVLRLPELRLILITHLIKRFDILPDCAEWASYFLQPFEIPAANLLPNFRCGQPYRGSCPFIWGFVATEAQVVAQGGIAVAGMAGVHHNFKGLHTSGEGYGEHTVRLFGLAVGLVVVVASLMKLGVVQVQTSSPIAGDVHHSCG